MSIKNLHDFYVDQLKDMYSSEKQLTEALPKMAKAASNPELQKAFTQHLQQTETHMETVRVLLDELDENPGNKKCRAMEGLIEEGSSVIKEKGNADAKDAALIVAAQKVEHDEIASYGSLQTFAGTLGYDKAAQKLQAILDEEYTADQTLDDLAMGAHQRAGLNAAAKA